MNVIVTGSNSGFGRRIVETLAQAGHTVFATMRDAGGRNAKAAQELKAFGAANGNRVHVVELDVTKDASVAKGIDAIAKQVGGAIDVLVNNAGRFSAGVQEAFTVEEVKALFETNVFGPLRLNRAVLPHIVHASQLGCADSRWVGYHREDSRQRRRRAGDLACARPDRAR